MNMGKTCIETLHRKAPGSPSGVKTQVVDRANWCVTVWIVMLCPQSV